MNRTHKHTSPPRKFWLNTRICLLISASVFALLVGSAWILKGNTPLAAAAAPNLSGSEEREEEEGPSIQGDESTTSAPPDLRPYARPAIAQDHIPRPNLTPTITVIDAVVNNTNPNLQNTDTFGDSEPTIAINPLNPNEIVLTAFSGSWGTNTPIWHSTDGGNLWTKEFTVPQPPGAGNGTTGCPCDQAVDYGRGNRMSGTFLSFTPTDVYSGTTNDPTSSAAWGWLLSMGAAQRTNSVAAGNTDQPWLLVNRDPSTASQDNVYVAYDDFTVSPRGMRVAVAAGSNPPNFTTDNLAGLGPTGTINPGHRLAVDPNSGAVYSLFQQLVQTNGDGSRRINYMLNRSTNAGATWGLNASATGIIVATADSNQPTPKFGTVNALLGGVLHATVDPTNGDVFYVYGNRDSGTGNNRLAIRRLTDNGMGGLNVGAEVFITGQVQAALPSVTVAANGVLGVLYDTYDGMNSGFPQFTAHLAVSMDHGATFMDNVLETFLSSAADNSDPRQRVLGDYHQIKSVGNVMYGVFTGNGVPFGRSTSNHDPIFFKANVGSCAIVCPANITVGNAANQCGANVNYPVPMTSGGCTGVTCSPASGNFYPLGTTTVTCTTADGPMCSFTITVNDTQAPTITCPANIFVGTTGNSATVTYPAPTVSDNCPGVGAPTCTPASGSAFNVGVTTVTCTVKDAANNTGMCSFQITVNKVTGAANDPLACTGPGNTVTVTLNISNNGNVNQNVADTTTFTNLVGVPGSCTTNVGTCNVTNAGMTFSGTLTPGQTATITYLTQVSDLAAPGVQVCANNSVTFNAGPALVFSACRPVTCPAPGPGNLFPAKSEVSDQKAGSVLIYNVYTSGATSGNTQNTRLNITNVHSVLPAFVHLFFVAEGCSVADSYICLTPNQTASFLASDLDPGTTGYLVAVVVDQRGCPVNFNYLIGDEYVKFTSGHAANLGAQAFAAIPGGLPLCDGNSVTSTIAFDGVSYNRVPRTLAVSSVGSRADGNDTLLVVNRIGGNLGIGSSTLGTLFGILYDDAENSLSFSVSGNCQLRGSLSNNFPRTAPRFETFIPAGRTGWLKLFSQSPTDIGILGAEINFNANAASSAGAFNQGHNLHALTFSATNSYVIPVFPPSC